VLNSLNVEVNLQVTGKYTTVLIISQQKRYLRNGGNSLSNPNACGGTTPPNKLPSFHD
jgi:hypothetical protein